PEAAGGELLEAEHVHDADRRQAGAEQVRPLRHDRADQQAAVAAALDGQLVGARVALLDEVLRRGDEVVEDVLLLQLGARLVPLPAVPPPRRAGGPARPRRPSPPPPAGPPRTGGSWGF